MEIKSHFKLENAFFINLNFHRGPEVTDYEQSVIAELSVNDNLTDTLIQVNVRLKSSENPSLTFSMELVGLFTYEGNKADCTKKVIETYLSTQGLPMLWSYFVQMSRMITSALGMNPVIIKTPSSWVINLEKQEENLPVIADTE